MMKFKLLVLSILLLLSNGAFAKPKIITTISPVGSLVSALVGDGADVEVILTQSGCPHDYSARPSDVLKLENIDLAIYIDEEFDSFFVKLLQNYHGSKFRVSDLSALNLKDQGKVNWHFWLDLDKVMLFEQEIAKVLIEHFPDLKNIVQTNLDDQYAKLKRLKEQKDELLLGLENFIVISESLEHFFTNYKGDNIMQLYKSSSSSLKSANDSLLAVENFKPKCILLDIEQSPGAYGQTNAKLIRLDSDNWQVSGELSDLFATKYRQILSLLEECKR